MSKRISSKVSRDFAEMSDGARYKCNDTASGGWVRISLKRHEQKEGIHNNSARRRIKRVMNG